MPKNFLKNTNSFSMSVIHKSQIFKKQEVTLKFIEEIFIYMWVKWNYKNNYIVHGKIPISF